MGVVSAPIRYTLHVNLVKLKLAKPIEGKKLILTIKAMDTEKSVDVSLEKKEPNDNVFAINSDLQFNLSYGVTKISVQGHIPKKYGGKTLAFYNDLSLSKLFISDDILKFEC